MASSPLLWALSQPVVVYFLSLEIYGSHFGWLERPAQQSECYLGLLLCDETFTLDVMHPITSCVRAAVATCGALLIGLIQDPILNYWRRLLADNVPC